MAREVLVKLISSKKESEEILVLSRYKYRLWGLENHFPNRDKQNLRFMTIHKAKGTEADYVLVLGLVNGLRGFPSVLSDPEIFDIVKPEKMLRNEKMTLEEERRLFYVALTRCRKELHLFTSKSDRSPFASEIQRFLMPVDNDTVGERRQSNS